MKDEQRFHILSDTMLEHIAERLEDDDGVWCDVELRGGSLTIVLENRQQYLINKHVAMEQIWVSSPISGARHYAYDENRHAWVSTRQRDETLPDFLSEELSALAGKEIVF